MSLPVPSFSIRTAVIGALVLVSGNAFAGNSNGVIAFAPDSFAVPAINGPMLAVLGLLMAVIAYRIFRSSNSNLGRMASVAVIAGGTVLAGINGAGSLRAIPDPVVEPDPEQCDTGGEKNFQNPPVGEFKNSCPNTQRIIRVECDLMAKKGVEERVNLIPICNEGVLLDTDQRCMLPYCGPV